MYECDAAKNKAGFIYLLNTPLLHSHSLPKSFSSCFWLALRGAELKIEVFPVHVSRIISLSV